MITTDFILNSLLVLVVLLNFPMLGSSRMQAVIQTVALQGFLLGLMPLVGHNQIRWELLIICLLTMAIKGAFIPGLLNRALREVRIQREVAPVLGFTPSILLGGLGTGLAVLFANTLPLAPNQANTLILPASFSTVLTGFLILTTRQKAITQVVGYLTLENGIFIFGLLLLDAMPFLVETGVLLDLSVGVFVMGIILRYIQRTFSSLEAAPLTTVRE
ncbi:MAG TPA: hydrogenase [Acidobacteriota bacterium]|nr:hydrogenase [Acidobacteriota bacterium]HND20214.1 hydrogenase [Acidobacteriota bacterium]HNJ41114.1 hydrogenase [Acidobacteriota bacterium]